MHRISWRVKLFIFFGLVALIPLGISGWNMIGIADDEFKNSTNTELSFVVGEVSSHINNSFTNQWMQPLFLLKSSLEGSSLGVNEKMALVAAATRDVKELLCVQLYVRLSPQNYQLAFEAVKDSIKQQANTAEGIAQVFLKPQAVGRYDKNEIEKDVPFYIPSLGRWVMRIGIPVKIGPANAVMVTLIDLNDLEAYLRQHFYTRIGGLYLVDADGKQLFDKSGSSLVDRKVVQNVISTIKSGHRAQASTPYTSSSGEKMVSSYAFPENLDWAVIAEVKEARAYEGVFKIRTSLMYWLVIGLGIAVAGGFIFSNDISKPIIKLSKEAEKISHGDFDIKAAYKGNDAIGVLGTTLENMSQSLKESFAKIAEQNRQLEEYNRTLERKVDERTLQLKEKNEALEVTLKKLKDTQEQLVMQQKLASLGQLTAGIAHEIKNPLNFVNNFARLSVGLVEEISEELDRGKEDATKLDIGYVEEILGDIKTNVTKISEHGARADNIVKNMLEHSRADSGEFTKTDINKLLDEAIHLSYHGMKTNDQAFNTALDFNLDKNITPVNLNAQTLSQVFINLSNNSFYALKKRKAAEGAAFEPRFLVTTHDLGNQIEIILRDNGTGIPEQIVKKIFEPFFTTKPTGEGTGLGLSLSFDIITQMHRGEMFVASQENNYTEFTIRLPKDLSSI
jgi:signal transduction histidine kinase